MPEQLSREQRLEIALRDMIRHYRNALESARSRIIEAHDGDESACDTVEQMTRHDPYIRNAEKALALGVETCGEGSDWCMKPECRKCHPKASPAGVQASRHQTRGPATTDTTGETP